MNCLETLDKFLEDCPNELSLDTETTGLKWSDEAFMVSYCWESEDYITGYIDLRTDPILWDRLREYIEIVEPNIVFHNAKFDMHKLNYYPAKFDDTCLMIYLLNEHHVKGLKPAAEKILGETTDEAERLKEAKKELIKEAKKLGINRKMADIGYHELPVAVVAPYAEKDALFTLKLHAKLANAIKKIPTVAAVYTLEKQLILDVCTIERHGMAIDEEYVRLKMIQLGDEIVRIEKRMQVLVNKPVGTGPNDFNPRSPQQVLAIFHSMGYNVSGTGIADLVTIDHELARLMVEKRTKDKLKTTYLAAMLDEAVDGLCHPNFNLTQTVTKRFSSSGASE